MIKEINLDNLNEVELFCQNSTDNLINIDDIKKDLIANPFSQYIVYIIDNRIVGFANYSIMYDKAEVADIAVLEQYRRQQIATKMMAYVIENVTKVGCQNITLEVRKSNIQAINLYKKFGFQEIAIRKNYYGNEDGILMEKKLVEICTY